MTRVRDGAGNLDLQTLCPAEPLTLGRLGQAARHAVLTGWKLYLPEGSDVTPRDHLQVRGIEYSILGEPAVYAGGGLVVDVADIWTAQCTIRHPGGTSGGFDSAAGTYPTTPNEPHYTGGCQVWVPSPADQQALFAEQLVTEIGYVVVVDVDTSTAVKVGDVVTVTSVDDNGDPMLVGKELQVRSFVRGEFPWQRDLRCTFQLPTD